MTIHPVADGEECPVCGADAVGNFDPHFRIEMANHAITRLFFCTGDCDECGWSNEELLTR